MKHFDFWRKWLITMGALHVLFGASLILPALIDLEFLHINSAFWPSGVVPEATKKFYSWMFAVYAASKISWALFIIFMAQFPFRKKEKWAWYCLFVCISTWFVVDTYFCYSFGAFDKVNSNSLFYMLLVLPLTFTWRSFNGDEEGEE